MDPIAAFKRLIEAIESEEKVDPNNITKLTQLLLHLSPQAPIRSQRDLESSVMKADQLLGGIFDKFDCSDEILMCQVLNLFLTYGYFRIAQITYHIAPQDTEPNLLYMPLVVKSKWYHLEPLLPEPTNLKWKGVINHCLVKDGNPNLLQVCLKLLKQKLHFYNNLAALSQHQTYSSVIKSNGQKVCEKIVEFLMSVAFDDDAMTGLDKSLFDLLMPFADEEQQKVIVESIIRDLFKPQMLQVKSSDPEIICLYEIVNKSIMVDARLQELFFNCLFEHLRCNITRRKRRLSSESGNENGHLTIESILSDILNQASEPKELIDKCKTIEVPGKSLQKNFLLYYTDIVLEILAQVNNIVPNVSQKLLLITSMMVISLSSHLKKDLVAKITSIGAKAIDSTSRSKLDKIFSRCDAQFLTEFTLALGEKQADVLTDYDCPTQTIFKSYMASFFQCCVMRGAKYDCEKFDLFIEFLCQKSSTIPRQATHLLQYVCVRELANCIEIFNHRIASKVATSFQCWSSSCCKGLFKFIKRNSPWKSLVTCNGAQHSDTDDLDISHDSNGQGSVSKHLVAADALICSLRIATERKDLETLDAYSDLLLKLFENFLVRFGLMIDVVKSGQVDSNSHLDSYSPKLLRLYVKHKTLLSGYIQYDLVDRLADVIIEKVSTKPNGKGSNGKGSKKPLDRKDAYNHIKSKLDTIEKKSQQNSNIYQTIINQQYGSSAETTIGSIGDITREKDCGEDYSAQSKALGELSRIIVHECSVETYKKVVECIMNQLEKCDPLDHVLVMYLFLMLKSTCPAPKTSGVQSAPDDQAKFDSFKSCLSKLSCSLVRLAKSVEMGPSIHTFTRPGCHLSNRSIQCCTYSNSISLYSIIFSRFNPKITNPLITDAMQTCVSSKLIQYAKHSVQMHRYFTQLASTQAQLLKAICIGRKDPEVLKTSMPIFLTVLTNLIRCLIMSSDLRNINKIAANTAPDNDEDDDVQDTKVSSQFENELELLALDVGRMMNNISLLRVKMVDFAPHLISSYVKDIQKASCPGSVRLHLNEGIFRIFDLVYAHQKERQESTMEDDFQRKTVAGKASGSLFEMIYARLDQASREILRDMHDNYDKFYRYTGKC